MANIEIIGSGVVGKATGKGFIARGHSVLFYDVNQETIEDIKKQGLSAYHADTIEVRRSDIFFFTVPTPTENGKINLSYMESAAKNLGGKLRNRDGYFVVVVRSTVLPGTTENLVIPIIERESGKKAGKDFGVAMNPEYLREKSSEKDFYNPWIITIGSLDQRSAGVLSEVYANFKCPVVHLSIKEAEFQKYVHNLFNAVKIAFFNEMRMTGEKIGVNPGSGADQVFKVTSDSAEGSWNKNYGIKDMGPFDGMCLPKDTQAFLSWSEQFGLELDVLESAIKANNKFSSFWNLRKSPIIH